MKLKDLGVLPEWDSPATEWLGQNERNRLIYELEEVDISEALHKAGWIEKSKIEIDKGKLQALASREEWYVDYTDGREMLEERIINNIQLLIKEQHENKE